MSVHVVDSLWPSEDIVRKKSCLAPFSVIIIIITIIIIIIYYIIVIIIIVVVVGARRGVTVSMSAFLSLPPMLLRGFESGLGLESSGCSMWHFLKLVARGFLRVLWFPPLLYGFNDSANKIKLK